jgi:hypothetical protein
MNGMALLLVLTTPGIEYGWNPGPDGQLEYVIQLEPQALDALRGGKEISSDIHPEVRSVRRFVLRVGEGPVPRIAIAPEALEDSEAEDDQVTAPQTPRSRTGSTAPRTIDRTATEGQRATSNRSGRNSSTTNPSGRTRESTGSGRSAPPLLSNNAQAVGASISGDDSSETGERFNENQTDAEGQFTLTDDATEDGAGPYDRVRSPSRYTEFENGDSENSEADNGDVEEEPVDEESDASIWSRWNQAVRQDTNQNRWQPAPDDEPQENPRDVPPDPDAAWAQDSTPSRLGAPNSPTSQRDVWNNARPDVQPPELASRAMTDQSNQVNGNSQNTYMAAGYSETQTPTNNQPNATNSANNSPSASDLTNPVTAAGPAASTTAPGASLFKELLLFASLGVNVAAVIIARQYYLRYTMLVQEIRESETLAT